MNAPTRDYGPIARSICGGKSFLQFALEPVPESLVLRHLGMPSGVELDPGFLRHLERSREWFSAHASPWSAVKLRRIEFVDDERVHLEGGIVFKSDVLADGFRSTGAGAVAAVGISAGAEVDAEIDRLFKAGQPDDAMFLNAHAIAFVEHLRKRGADHLREAVAAQGLLALPFYSPGYEGWRLEDQQALLSALDDEGPVEVLESGALTPEKSTLLCIGLSPRLELAGEANSATFWDRQSRAATVLHERPEYGFARKTLKKWARDRLTLIAKPSGSIQAIFRVSGSTCANMGLPLAFEYRVDLKPETGGSYRLQNCRCAPAENDTNHRSTCLYLSNPEAMIAGMNEKPQLEGGRIEDALHWNPDVSPAGCLCLRSSRDHKWRVVFQTIHFALAENSPTSLCQS